MRKLGLFIVAAILSVLVVKAQEVDTLGAYIIKLDKKLAATPVKNQYRSGTCWSFSGLSFIESELLRLGKGEYDLSEMFVVRNVYSDKAEKYVRLHGHLNFGAGGAFHDVTYVMKNYGLVPEEAYTGLNYGEPKHVHMEMDEVLKNFVDAIVKDPNKKLTPVWHEAFNRILDTYLGEYPKEFTYKGKKYTPKSFMKELGLNPDDYVEITSFSHHPFYTKFPIELPDNWLWYSDYNVPLEDMIKIIDNALKNGYTVAWASDVSEDGFMWRKGIAILPDADNQKETGLELARWVKMSRSEKMDYISKHTVKEMNVTQEIRQKQFDNYKTTDDHGMHIIGYGHDQNGTKFYLVKNSWGTDNNPLKGYFYASEAFVKAKTTAIMVHKDAIPKDIRKKLGL